MIYVTNNGQSEPLVYLSSFEMEQEVKGDFSISFNSVNDSKNIGHSLLLEESIITVDDFDFRVKQMKETRQGKQVTALSTYFDLVDQRKDDIYGGTRTFNEFLTFIFLGSGWTTSTDFNESRMIENFGENNLIALTNALCQVFECEFEIRKNNHVHFSKKIGRDHDFQYRYGHNVQALSKDVDTTKLKTVVKGYGATNSETGAQLYVYYESANVAKFGKREADPIHDDRFENAQAFTQYLADSLQDEPEVTFELDSIELLDKELGETVWLIYEPLDIEIQTRILAQSKGFVNGQLKTVKVVLGNSLPKSTTDILISQKVEIDEQKKVTRSKFEQTNDKIEFEVERIGDSISQIKLDADSLTLRVAQNEGDITRHESSIQLNKDQIELRVKETDYNGNEIATRINMSSTTIDIQGSKINLIGAVTVLSDITGNLGTITTGTLNSVDINTHKDIHIGNSLYFNGAVGNITAGGNGIAINSFGGYVYLNGTVDFQNQSSVNGSNIRVGYAEASTTTNHISGSNVSGEVASARYAKDAGTANGTYVDYDNKFIYVRNSSGTILARADRVSGA